MIDTETTTREQLLGNLRDWLPDEQAQAIKGYRRERWKLQGIAREIMSGLRIGRNNNEHRVMLCNRTPTSKITEMGGAGGVSIMVDGCSHKAYYSGLQTCGSVWVCPVCSAKITEHRRGEMSQAVDNWKGSLVMVTLTLQHNRDDDLEGLLSALKDTWRRVKMGGWWKRFREQFGISAFCTSTEVTWGSINGWHPHLHVLMFIDVPEGELDVCQFKNRLRDRYRDLLAKHGKYASDYYGINVKMGDEQAGKYIAKYGMAHELTKWVNKRSQGGYSPFQLLELYGDGKRWAAPLFREYAQVFFGRAQLYWSRGARDLLAIGEELSDSEVASQEGGEVAMMVSLTWQQYKQVMSAGAQVRVLEVAERGDVWALWQFLQDELKIIPDRWQALALAPPEMDYVMIGA